MPVPPPPNSFRPSARSWRQLRVGSPFGLGPVGKALGLSLGLHGATAAVVLGLGLGFLGFPARVPQPPPVLSVQAREATPEPAPARPDQATLPPERAEPEMRPFLEDPPEPLIAEMPLLPATVAMRKQFRAAPPPPEPVREFAQLEAPPEPQTETPPQEAPAPAEAAARVEASYDPDGCPPPPYPRLARHQGLEGIVELLATVSPAGEILALEVTRSSGHEILDRAALDAVRGWTFRPAFDGDRPVRGQVPIRIRFEIASGVRGGSPAATK